LLKQCYTRLVEDLILKLFYWFKHSAARREDYKTVQISLQLDEVFLLRHVPSRWLSLQPAVVRIVSQWSAIKSYFKHLPEDDKAIEKNDHYKAFQILLDNPQTFVQLQFVSEVAPLFSGFLEMFQHEGPMVHVLYTALCDLVRKVMLRFLTTDAVGTRSGKHLLEINIRNMANMRPIDQLEIGECTKKAMTAVKKEQHKGILMDMRNFYICGAEYLLKNLPLSNTVLKDLSCLQPSARSEAESEGAIRRLARKLPQVILDDEVSIVSDEWKLYALDDLVLVEDDLKPYVVDSYWAKVLQRRNSLGQPKYSILGKVVKACLSLSHGNSDAERSFSSNKRTVTPERVSLSEETINAVRLVKDALRIRGGGKAINISVTHSLQQKARTAYSKYKEFQEQSRKKAPEEKKAAELNQQQREEERKRKQEEAARVKLRSEEKEMLKKHETELQGKEKEQHNILKSSGALLHEAEEKLSTAIKSGNIDQIGISHGLLEVARKRMDSATAELCSIAQTRKRNAEKAALADNQDHRTKRQIPSDASK